MATIHCLNQHRAFKEAKAALDAVGGTMEKGWELDEDAMAEYFAIVHVNQSNEGGEEDGEV